jgi:hypothetical protein
VKTRQNKKPQILLRGFPINRSSQRNLFPRNTLTAFLNVDIKNPSEIDKFCGDYNYLPSGDLDKFYRNFSQEQKSIKNIANKLVDSSLSSNDLLKINKYLTKVHPQLIQVTGKEINEINKELGGIEEEINKQSFFTLSNVNMSTNVSLWYELARRIEAKDLSQCLNCGKFIIISKSTQHKKYCDDYCKNSYHQRKRRRKTIS